MTAVSGLAYQRSHDNNCVQKVNTVYFKAHGTSAKAIDTINAVGLGMAQRTAYRLINEIADQEITERNELVKEHPFRAGHDNLNIAFKVYQARLDHDSHFDSGTAATVYVIQDPEAASPDPQAYSDQWTVGVKNPITPIDLVMLEAAAHERLAEQAKYFILKFLMEAPAFSFSTYEHKAHHAFQRPPAVNQLPVGKEHITAPYMLKTTHQEEVSLDGNRKVVKDVLSQVSHILVAHACHSLRCTSQLGFKTDEEMRNFAAGNVLVYFGDQLTVERVRGLKKEHHWDINKADRLEFIVPTFGWFHAQIAEEHSLHDQHYTGTSAGMNLKHAFDVLHRKGLASPSVAGNFHQKLQEGLKHTAEAHFRLLWQVFGRVTDLSQLRSKTPEQLKAMAGRIFSEFACSRAIWKHQQQPKNEQDHLMLNSMIFARDMLNYFDLDDAMRTGDVGRMRDHLPRLYFRFHGGKNHKYAIEILELIQGLEREWPEDLV